MPAIAALLGDGDRAGEQVTRRERLEQREVARRRLVYAGEHAVDDAAAGAGPEHERGHAAPPSDVVAFRGDQRHSYHNPGARPAIAYSVVVLARVR